MELCMRNDKPKLKLAENMFAGYLFQQLYPLLIENDEKIERAKSLGLHDEAVELSSIGEQLETLIPRSTAQA